MKFAERSAVNELAWVSLQVHDVEQTRFFWREVIGLREHSAAPGWVELELRPGLLLALHPIFHPPALERRGYRSRRLLVLGIRVRELEAMGRLVEQHGGRALGAPHDIPGGRARDFQCLDGYLFELVEVEDARACLTFTVYLEALRARLLGAELRAIRQLFANASPFVVRTFDPPISAARGLRVQELAPDRQAAGAAAVRWFASR